MDASGTEKSFRKIEVSEIAKPDLKHISRQQWLVTNGIGGYSSSTIAGCVSWRYHGLLVAALPAPFGRMVMLSQIINSLAVDETNWVQLNEAGFEQEGDQEFCRYLQEFRLENQLPTWRYRINDIVFEKQLVLLHGQNTVHLNFSLLSTSRPVRLRTQPYLNFRGHDNPITREVEGNYQLVISDHRYEVTEAKTGLVLRLGLDSEREIFQRRDRSTLEIFYERDAERGAESSGMLWSPGFFELVLNPGEKATLVISTESWESMLALNRDQALLAHNRRCVDLLNHASALLSEPPLTELVLAADQFVIKPVGRAREAAKTSAQGDEIRTIIAGYHWFTDWGRDTMISLEGLTMLTGRMPEAGWILRTFAHSIRQGLIPNLYPEAGAEGLYHTADATLWYFHALDRYLHYTNDNETLRGLFPQLTDVIDHHIRGTLFGIHADPKDNLLSQGQEGYQLTWMDAKVDGWVVTPRRGKAVEINALWYNAVRLMQKWAGQIGEPEAGRRHEELAEGIRKSFNRRFWSEQAGWLYDVVDGEEGDDVSCRPNQIIAISLPHPVLEERRWKAVLEVVQTKLLTPYGLRSLSPNHPDYKPRYFGDLRARDAAYHQGTVWAWLIGPFVDAWLKVNGNDLAGARKFLKAFETHLGEACLGTINEIFDAEPPFAPRGCIAQAWSVAEVLRVWAKTSAAMTERNAQDLGHPSALPERGEAAILVPNQR